MTDGKAVLEYAFGPGYEPRRRLLASAILLCIDLVFMLAVTIWIFSNGASPVVQTSSQTLSSDVGLSIFMALIVVTMISLRGGYGFTFLADASELFANAAKSVLMSFGVISLVLLLTGTSVDVVRFGYAFLACLMVVISARAVEWRFRLLSLHLDFGIKFVAVGDSAALKSVTDRIRKFGSTASCVGVVSDENLTSKVGSLPYLGRPDNIRSIVQSADASVVVVCTDRYIPGYASQLAWLLANTGVNLVDSAAFSNNGGLKMNLRVHFGLPLIELVPPGLTRRNRVSKRMLDLFVSVSALVLLVPVLAAVALAILAEDGRPIIFKQKRVGRGGEEFYCLKFRSMRIGADAEELKLRAIHHRPGKMWKVKGDPRITRVGAFIRKTSLDELPQLINVLNGSMSLVGPRPKQAWEYTDFESSATGRLLVKPGVTGLSQVRGRSDLSVAEAAALDLEYVQNWSLASDVTILLQTAGVVLKSSGSY